MISSSSPEHITALPWDPGSFSGTLQLGVGNLSGADSTCSAPSNIDCWLTEVPIVIGSGMSIVGSGNVGAGANLHFDKGTAIVPGANFPTPLGQPTFSNANLSCGSPGTGQTYYVQVVEVNNLDTNTGTLPLLVPGFSAVSSEASITCTSGSSVTVAEPTGSSGTAPLAATDYRVFAASSSGQETLQAPNLGLGMSCATLGATDKVYACKLVTGGNSATITSLQINGDFPNLIDLSNPLVVEIGPFGGTSGTTTQQNEGFWALLKNLTLDTFSPAAASTPNVAFWNPSDQENSGLSFVNFAGPFGSTTDNSVGGGSWIYVGNHAPNSFVSNVQTDTNPGSGAVFTGMILDGRPGFGTAVGTARRLSNSTFTPGQGGTASIQAGILITGSKAVASFDQVHVETPSGADSNFEVTNGATVSVVGPTQLGNTIVHLTSTGTGITVKNVSAPSGSQVIKDDLNGVNNLGSYVASYSSSLQAGTLRAFTSLTLPNQTANLIYAGPSSGPAAAPSFRSMVAADLPTSGTVQVLAAGLPSVSSSGNSTYLGWLGGAFGASASILSSMIASGGTITGLFVGVSATYANAVTFTVASCTPSSSVNCSAPTDSNLTCTISGTAEQCNDTNAAHALSLSAGDEVFLHVTTTGASIPTRSVFMSYRLTGVQ